MSAVELALGTVQFGLPYGISGRSERVPDEEIRAILDAAWRAGVRVLDTAPVYGDIEGRLNSLAGQHDFAIVSKIPALNDMDNVEAVAEFVRASVWHTRQRLGNRLTTLLFHRGADLLEPFGATAFRSAAEAVAGTDITLGVSCYAPSEVLLVRDRFPIRVVQLPGNALDQRVRALSGLDGVEVHLRSCFLQGLLLMTPTEVERKLPKAANALSRWRNWYAARGYDPLRAALGVAKALPGVRYCVVGVDSRKHLEEIASAWKVAEPLDAHDLAIDDQNITDPRRWHLGASDARG